MATLVEKVFLGRGLIVNSSDIYFLSTFRKRISEDVCNLTDLALSGHPLDLYLAISRIRDPSSSLPGSQ